MATKHRAIKHGDMHGGKRKGAGRKPAAGDEPQERLTVTLPASYVAWLKRDGNASAETRRIIERVAFIEGIKL